jgi:hypothetical protein
MPGANPTIVSYNASAVKSLVRFENKNAVVYNETRSSLLKRYKL